VILKQLHTRRYVKVSGSAETKKWALTTEGSRHAEDLRESGFDDFRPVSLSPKLSVEDWDPPAVKTKGPHEETPVLSRVALKLFLAGASATKYLTPTQKRLLLSVSSQSGGQISEKPNERTANALVKFKLAERDAGYFRVTEAGYQAVEDLKI